MAKGEKQEQPKTEHVKMAKGELVADVHKDEVENYAAGGYVLVKE